MGCWTWRDRSAPTRGHIASGELGYHVLDTLASIDEAIDRAALSRSQARSRPSRSCPRSGTHSRPHSRGQAGWEPSSSRVAVPTVAEIDPLAWRKNT
jgi:hypothetical protein